MKKIQITNCVVRVPGPAVANTTEPLSFFWFFGSSGIFLLHLVVSSGSKDDDVGEIKEKSPF